MQFLRYLYIPILLSFACLGWLSAGPYCLLFFSEIGIHVSLISVILNTIATSHQVSNPEKVSGYKFFVWRTAVIVYEVNMVFNFMITLIFWTVLWWHPTEWSWIDYYMAIIHIVPFSVPCQEFVIQRWSFRYNHFVVILMLATFYLALSYYWAKTHWPIYAFLSWEDIGTWIFAFIVLFFGYLSFVVFYWIAKLKQKQQKTKVIQGFMINNQQALVPVEFVYQV